MMYIYFILSPSTSVISKAHSSLRCKRVLCRRFIERITRTQTAQLIILQISVQSSISVVLSLSIVSILDPALEWIEPDDGAHSVVEALSSGQAAKSFKFDFQKSIGKANNHIHWYRKAQDDTNSEQYQRVYCLLDLPPKTAKLDIPFRIEVAIFEQHIEPYAMNTVQGRLLIPNNCFHGKSDQSYDGTGDDKASCHHQGRESLFQFGQKSVEIEDDENEEEKRPHVEATTSDRP